VSLDGAGYRTESVLCVPIRKRQGTEAEEGRVIGALMLQVSRGYTSFDLRSAWLC
jgi:hypothetical protein